MITEMRFPSECSTFAGGHFSQLASQRASEQPARQPASQQLSSNQPARRQPATIWKTSGRGAIPGCQNGDLNILVSAWTSTDTRGYPWTLVDIHKYHAHVSISDDINPQAYVIPFPWMSNGYHSPWIFSEATDNDDDAFTANQ